jgi:hypothetical protein
MFKRINVATLALATLVGGGSLLASTSAANAEVIMRKERINSDVCYQARRVPATVAYNTRGIRLSNASRSWTGNMQVNGGRVVDKHNDEVFIQTRKVVENQHMTLVQVPC